VRGGSAGDDSIPAGDATSEEPTRMAAMHGPASVDHFSQMSATPLPRDSCPARDGTRGLSACGQSKSTYG
jgi:hypothetical protein